MKKFTLLLILLFANVAFSQSFKLKSIKERVRDVSSTEREYSIIDNELDPKYGYYIKHGSYKELYKKNEVVSGHYKLGVKEGAWVYKDPEEEYFQKGNFKDGKKVGEWVSYLKGVLSVKEVYSQKGVLISLNRFDTKNNLVEDYSYDSIKKISFRKNFIGNWYSREVTKTDANNVDIKLFYPNGKLVQEKKLYKEKLIYASAIYDTIGQVLILSTVNGGDGVLQTVYLDELAKGVIVNKNNITYINGVPNGNFEEYNFKGKLILQGNYSDGEKKGQWKTWSTSKKAYVYKYYRINLDEEKSFKADAIDFKNSQSRWFNQVQLSLMKKKKGKRLDLSKNDFSKMVHQCFVRNIDTKKLAPYFNEGKPGKYKIVVMFNINDLGEVSDVKVRSMAQSIVVKEQVEKALSKLPTLIPASQNSKFVNLRFNIPLDFNI